MPLRRFLFVAVSAMSMSCATNKAQPDGKEMIPLDGADPAFAAGRKTFGHPKSRCYDAVLAAFRNSGHGVDREDVAAGKIVSGKTTVYSGTRAKGGTVTQVKVDDKFYVSVEDEGAGCVVSVDKLRAWNGTVEVDTRTASWVRAQLTGFMKGVEQELADVQ